MKKAYIWGLLAVGVLGFTACDNYEEPNAPAQSNEQCAILAPEDVTVASAVADGQTLGLQEINDAGEAIALATISVPTMPEGYTFAPVLEISGNGFAKAGVVPCSVVAVEDETAEEASYTVMVNPDDLQGIYVSTVSKSPKAKDIEWRMKLPVELGSKPAGVIGGADKYFGPFTVNVLPMPTGLVIEENYYLLGTANDWSVATAIKLDHTGDPYDNPVFTGVFDVNGDWWWKIVPESTYVTGNWVDAANASYGVAENGDDALSGMLVGRTDTEDCGAGNLKVVGTYKLTINMEEGTYEFSLALPNLWIPGNHQGWSPSTAPMMGTTDYSNYYGYANLDGEFKFTGQPDWDPLNWGVGADAGQLGAGGGNLSVAEAGTYFVQANITDLTWSAAKVDVYGLIGDATPGGWDASTNLTSADGLVWTGEVTLAGSGEFKFRANDAWDINLGGDLANLTPGGDNIATPGEGTYVVTLDLSQMPLQATLVKK